MPTPNPSWAGGGYGQGGNVDIGSEHEILPVGIEFTSSALHWKSGRFLLLNVLLP
jgi:hypothetical protein